jgi:UDP-2,4-diacetamido-2,4,6-trideoxy-beta-L-altropyranose hydrolase
MAQLTYRLATMEDAKIIFDLSNEKLARANSFNKEEIKWENHVAWLSKKLVDSGYIILLYFLEKEFVGQVKFEKINEKQANMSMSIREMFRGKGYSDQMYDDSLEYLFGNRPDIESLVGFILPNNIPNIKGATKAGYVYVEDKLINGENYHTYIMTKESRKKAKENKKKHDV